MGTGKPMSRFKMQETSGTTVADFIGANTGTATSGNARRFNGTSDYISFGNQIIPLGTKTIKFKFRRNGNPSGTFYILDNGSSTSNNGTTIMVTSSGLLYFSSQQGASPTRFQFATRTSVCDNKWHEIMLTWDGTTNSNTAKIFVDDMITPVATATAASTETVASSFNLFLGRQASATAAYASMDIDDLQITNGYMMAGTVVAWWKCDDTAATAFVDSSSNAWAPTITGTTVISDTNIPILQDSDGTYFRRFNGRSDRITFTNQVLPLGAKSIRFKVRKFQLPVYNATMGFPYEVVMGSANSSAQNGTFLYINDTGKLAFASGSGGAWRFSVATSNSICDGIWHDILLVWDGTINSSGVKIYVDDMNNPVATGTATTLETANATNNFVIGNRPDLATYFQGDLKDITISVGTGNEQTDPKKMQVGDFIAASYVSGTSGAFGSFSGLGVQPSSFIPPASSATPNGGFYYIYVGDDFLGRKILVADRNVQQSISWDTLNTAGVASGSGVKAKGSYGNDVVPTLTSDTSASPIVISASKETFGAWYMFNNTITDNMGWYVSGSVGGWVKIDLGIGKTITQYTLTCFSSTFSALNEMIGSWIFQGSNDGSTWTTLDTQTGQTWSYSQKKLFPISNNTSYRYYRINVTGSSGGSNIGIGEMELMETVPFFSDTNTILTTRLLTGGTSSSDTDDEWDNIIVKSSLGGTITPGDNNVWNWNQAVYSWTSTVDSSTSANRSRRGYTTGVNAYGSNSTSTATTASGFRPVLLVENVFSLLNKSFLYFGGAYQKWNGSAWQVESATLPTSDVFQSDGFDISTVPSSAFDLVTSDFDLVTWTNLLPGSESAYLTATPKGQLLLGTYDFANLLDLTVAATASSDANLRFIASGDGGVTWKIFSGGSWSTVSADATTVASQGMTLATVNGLTSANWDALGGTVRLGYFIANDTVLDSLAYQKEPYATDTPTLNSVKLTFDELTIEGRMQDLEQQNAINMAKLQFKSNALLQADAYQLHDMVVDTFETATSVDSVSAKYDATNKQYAYDTSVSAPAVQEVILPTETIPSYSGKLMLNADQDGSVDYEYSLDGGSTWNTLTPFSIIDLTGKSGTNLKVKAKLKDSTAKLRGISFAWA